MRKLAIGALTLGVLLFMAALRVADLRRGRADALAAAESRAANLSVLVSAYLGEAFAAGDASLRQLALHSRRIGGPGAPDRNWAPSLASAKAGLASVGAISVVDREGVIRHSTRPEIIGQSRRTQGVLARAFEARDDALVIGTPFPTVATPPEPVLPIGRRLTNDRGIVDGAVFASFIPTVPRGFFRSVDVGERGTVWVFHPDGVVLVREPSAASPIGQPARANPVFALAMRSGPTGTLRAPVDPGGPVQVSAFHATTTPPLVVAVSLDQDEVLVQWRREARGAVLVFAALAVTLAATLGVLFRQMDAKARVERALAEAQRLEAERLRDANDRLAAALERERVARREAESASALKDHFLMTVSHELRTPLTAIYGWARMLVDGAVSERQRETALRTIERNAHAQRRLIDDLLDVAGVMGGKLRLDIHSVSLASIVENAIETVQPAADAKGVRLEAALGPDAGSIAGDEQRLQQVVWNLLSNAVKFTPAGGLVTVAVARSATAVDIVVTDTGVGISGDFLPHVFERFRQQDAGTERRYGGLGLGLTIVRNLVELHGGSVTAQSEGEGRGATFTVHLPAPAASSPNPTAPQPAHVLGPAAADGV